MGDPSWPDRSSIPPPLPSGSHLEAVINGRFDLLDEKLKKIQLEREYGDRELRQTVIANEVRIKDLTVDLGRMAAKVETAQEDWQRTVDSLRDGLKKAMSEALQGVKAEVVEHGSQKVADATRILPDMEGRLDKMEESVADVSSEVGKINKKLDSVKFAAIGVGIGAGLSSGTLVALLTKLL